jgi:methanogenic corrinoid protein MtbC1
MTTEESTIEDRSKQLTEMILKGDAENAARLAGQIGQKGTGANEVVDTISDAMNIVADFHELERYSSNQVEDSERAADKALEAVRPRIKVEQRRISGRVMVTSLEGDPHNFDKTLLLTMLHIGGFSALDGGTDLSADQVAKKVAQLRPDILAVPLVTSKAVDNLVKAKSRIDMEGSNTKIVAYGRGVTSLPDTARFNAVEEDSISVLSKITEILMQKS